MVHADPFDSNTTCTHHSHVLTARHPRVIRASSSARHLRICARSAKHFISYWDPIQGLHIIWCDTEGNHQSRLRRARYVNFLLRVSPSTTGLTASLPHNGLDFSARRYFIHRKVLLSERLDLLHRNAFSSKRPDLLHCNNVNSCFLAPTCFIFFRLFILTSMRVRFI